ncbi:Acetolactate synthase isozyme 2 large subunit [BD1-7 clade bacterium]|uniref:Acetolactate synthase isozyme 2 large subunit n=1 Tax=BD1-7 clade bacterium TaxID=2029982 RepID=A0A5S9QXC4_9GAMM|nr:Acetolactate synthase isozyme 2 large subunit [BD1-7 clade bacterium]
MQLCDALAHVLQVLNVRSVFGVSGANIEPFHDAVFRLGVSSLTNIFAKSESGAAFMADGYARTSGGLGVCCATSGGGMMNLAAGVAESQASGIPVLAIIGQVATEWEGAGGFQDSSGRGGSINGVELWRSMTQYAVRLQAADEFWQQLNLCLTLSLNGNKGATALLLPRDVQMMDVGAMPDWFFKRLARGFIDIPAVNTELTECVSTLFALLSACQNPLVVIGDAAVRDRAYADICEFLKSADIPVAVTLADICAYDRRERNFVGVIGACGEPSLHRYIEEQVDLVVVIGNNLDQMTQGPLTSILQTKPSVLIHHALKSVGPRLNVALTIHAPLVETFQLINDFHARQPLRFHGIKKLHRDKHPQIRLAAGDGLSNSMAIAAINPHLPENISLVLDAGNCAATAAHYLEPPPGARSSIALGMGGMGYGVASAVGVQLAQQAKESRSQPTVVFCGDGAFLMNGVEVHTAVELQLPIIWLVFNNQGHGMCRSRQELLFENRVTCSNFSAPVNISQLGEGLGLAADQVAQASSTAEIEAFLQSYFSQPEPGPALLELNIDVDEIPPFAPLIDIWTQQQSEEDAPVITA